VRSLLNFAPPDLLALGSTGRHAHLGGGTSLMRYAGCCWPGARPTGQRWSSPTSPPGLLRWWPTTRSRRSDG